MKNGETREQSEVAVFSLLEQGLAELDVRCTGGQLDQLLDFVFLLDHWASRINLTGHDGPIEMATRLILGAAALSARMPELAESESLADLGSGAGFPGIPVAILHPHLRVYLVESRLKRNHFQKEARRRLGLSQVTPVLGRSDEVAQTPCDVVVAQAMTQPEVALELMSQWSHPGSLLVLPASDSASPPESPDGVGAVSLREYRVPHVGTSRKLWVARIDSDDSHPR